MSTSSCNNSLPIMLQAIRNNTSLKRLKVSQHHFQDAQMAELLLSTIHTQLSTMYP
jgi:hypothetical protein